MVEDYIVEDDVEFDMVEDMMKVPLSMKSFINLRYTYNTLKLGPFFCGFVSGSRLQAVLVVDLLYHLLEY